MTVLIAIVIVALVAAFVLVPLRRGPGEAETVSTEDPVLADLEAQKAAKYREIRDTELDHAQGKLTEDEFKRQEAELRAEAIELLKRIDAHTHRAADDDSRPACGPAGRSV
jgi:hypothetical protein